MAQAVDDILKNAERAEHRAVNPAENQCQNGQNDDGYGIERKQCRYKLIFWQEAEVAGRNTCKINKNGCNGNENHYSKKNSDITEHSKLY